MFQPAAGNTRRKIRLTLWSLGFLVLLVQSITVTLPIQFDIRDRVSHSPIKDVDVLAVWQLESGNPGGYSPGSFIKVSRLKSDDQGHLRIGTTVLLHPPLVPFGLQFRSERYMPLLTLDKEGHRTMVAGNIMLDYNTPPTTSFLIFRRSNLNGRVIDMLPTTVAVPPDVDRLEQNQMGDAENAIGECDHTWYCQSD